MVNSVAHLCTVGRKSLDSKLFINNTFGLIKSSFRFHRDFRQQFFHFRRNCQTKCDYFRSLPYWMNFRESIEIRKQLILALSLRSIDSRSVEWHRSTAPDIHRPPQRVCTNNIRVKLTCYIIANINSTAKYIYIRWLWWWTQSCEAYDRAEHYVTYYITNFRVDATKISRQPDNWLPDGQHLQADATKLRIAKKNAWWLCRSIQTRCNGFYKYLVKYITQ